MKLHWLKLVMPCTLEIREVKDYAGQDLIFNQSGFRQRCVTDKGLCHPLVQKYIRQRLLEEVNRDGTPVIALTPAAAPTPKKKAASKKEEAPTPPLQDEKTVEINYTDPIVSIETEVTLELESVSPAEEKSVSESTATEEPTESSSFRRRRRRSKK